MWTVHIAALFVFFLLTIGFFSRTMALLGVSDRRVVRQSHHARRLLRPRQNQLHAGAVPDARAVRRPLLDRSPLAAAARRTREVPPSSTANLAIRLIQVHMCIIYLFSGIGKLQGEPWVDRRGELALVRPCSNTSRST